MKKSKRFSASFRPIVDNLKSGEKCSWRRHFNGVQRSLIGLLDLLASNDPNRIAYPGLKAIVQACKRYKGEPYSRSATLAALRALRADKIVGPLETCERFGYETTGFTVADHDAVCVREGNRCVYRGNAVAKQQQSNSNTVAGPQYYSGQNALPTALESGPQTGLRTALPSVLPSSPQDEDDKKLTSKNAPSTIQTTLTSQTVVTAVTAAGGQVQAGGESQRLIEKPVIPMAVNQHGSGNLSAAPAPADPHAKFKQPGTIGAHFGLPFWSDLTSVAEGLVTTTKQWEEFGYDEHDLENIMREVLLENYDQPYCGAATHAQLMDAAMKRFNAKYGKKVPKAWVKLMNDYRRKA